MNLGICGWNALKIQDQLDQNPNATGVVLLNQYEWEYTALGNNPGFEGVVDFVNRKNIPFHVITAGFKETGVLHDQKNLRYKNVFLYHWETFWLIKGYQEFLNNHCSGDIDIKNIEVGKNYSTFNKLFISLNNRCHGHRCLLLDLIAKYNLFDVGKISFGWNEHGPNPNSNHYVWKYWKPRQLIIDFKDPVQGQGILPIEYFYSFVQIVAESSANVGILSEKTSGPLFFNKLFLVLGAKNYYKSLDRLGFLRYDEIFNYDFDEIDSIELRAEMLIQNLVRLSKVPYDELSKIYTQLWPKIIYNKKRALEIAFSKQYLDRFILNLYESNDSSLVADINNNFFSLIK